MPKETVIYTIKLPKKMYEAIKKISEEEDYLSMADFIREAIKEHIKRIMERRDKA